MHQHTNQTSFRLSLKGINFVVYPCCDWHTDKSLMLCLPTSCPLRTLGRHMHRFTLGNDLSYPTLVSVADVRMLRMCHDSHFFASSCTLRLPPHISLSLPLCFYIFLNFPSFSAGPSGLFHGPCRPLLPLRSVSG